MLLIDFVGLEEEEQNGGVVVAVVKERFGHIVCAGGSGYGVLLWCSMFCFTTFDPDVGEVYSEA